MTHAFVMENKVGNKSRCSKQNKSRGRSKFREKVKCYHCSKINHMKRLLKQGIDKNQQQVDNRNTTTTTSTSDNKLTLLCNQENFCHVADQDIEWIVDSSASYHRVPKREYFFTYKAGDFGVEKMGNTSVSQIMGIDNICIRASMGCTLTLKDE